MVMIHGAFCGGWAFDALRPIFAQRGYRAIAPNLRHHDRGAYPPEALGTTSVLDYADDLEKLILALDEPPILVGHSMGGLIAQMLAARGLARALVLLAPSAPWGVLPSTPFEVASAQALFLAGDFWSMPLRPSYWIAAANALDRMPEPAHREIFARFVPESGLACFEVMHWPLDARRASFVHARDVACPVLVLAGSRDRVNPPATVRCVAKRYGGRAQFEILEGRGHWLIGEPGYEVVAQRMVRWLDDALAPASIAAD